MDKLIDLLVKGIQALFQPKILWLIIVACVILYLLLFIPGVSSFLGIAEVLSYPLFVSGNTTITVQSLIGIIAVALIALIFAKVVLWVVGLIKDQFA